MLNFVYIPPSCFGMYFLLPNLEYTFVNYLILFLSEIVLHIILFIQVKHIAESLLLINYSNFSHTYAAARCGYPNEGSWKRLHIIIQYPFHIFTIVLAVSTSKTI